MVEQWKDSALDHKLTIADRATRRKIDEALQGGVALVRRIKLRLHGQRAGNFVPQLCGIQDIIINLNRPYFSRPRKYRRLYSEPIF